MHTFVLSEGAIEKDLVEYHSIHEHYMEFIEPFTVMK